MKLIAECCAEADIGEPLLRMLTKLVPVLERKFMSCSHGQELGQLVDLSSDWLFTLVSQSGARSVS